MKAIQIQSLISFKFSALVGSIACLTLALSPAHAATGNFVSPLTSAFLSVDFNGGNIGANLSTTEGWNGSSVAPDNFGVLWSPWGGPTTGSGAGNTGGDGVQLPSSQSTPIIAANSITKSFGPITASLSINVANNSASYATVNGVASLNSRDRGAPTGAANDGDLFRDLVFAGGSGANVQGTSHLILSLSGLTPGNAYQVAAYSFDTTGAHSMNWTATAPTLALGRSGWWDGTAANNNFTAPADEQTIAWTGGGATQAPAIFTLIADVGGNLSLYGWGGNGVTGNQTADTSYINGFQIAPVAVPEPSSLALLGVGAVVSAFAFRRRSARR